jgi:hypothetical protein
LSTLLRRYHESKEFQRRLATFTPSVTQRKIPIMDKSISVTDHQQYHTPDRLSPRLSNNCIWFAEAMTPSGIPSSRMVLFKQLDKRGFTFFTNYASRKSRKPACGSHVLLARDAPLGTRRGAGGEGE